MSRRFGPLAAMVRLNLRASLARPGAALLEAGFMFANNLIFFIIWLIFFRHFSTIRGWQLEDLALLQGIGSFAFGIAMLLCGGMRDVARTIAGGGLDVHLGRPTHPLPSLLLSRPIPSGIGDIASAMVFWFYFAGRGVLELPMLVLVATSAAVVIVAVITTVHCLAFWLPRIVQLSEQFFNIFMLISIYPQHVFGSGLRLLLFTLLPAAFVGLLPVEAIREASVLKALGVVAAALIYATLAILVFERGLRRYTSGNRLLELR